MRNQGSWRQSCRHSPRETEASCYRHGSDPPRVSDSPHPDCRPPDKILSRLPLLVFAWLTFWIITVPLFHIHFPDTTDRWSVLHSSGAHTVFTPDLPGEFSPPFHNTHRGASTHIGPRGVNSPELGIALFDDKSKKWKNQQTLDAHSRFRDTPLHPSTVFASPQPYPILHLFQPFSAPRGPPSLSCA